MPHFPHTPEALLGRNDSKNPNNTCSGLTSSGRPCRRAIASPKTPQITGTASDGALNSPLFCWQHKDQAPETHEQTGDVPIPQPTRRSTNRLFPLQERSSIDTLVQKLGIVPSEVGGAQEPQKRTRRTDNPRPPQKTATYDYAHRNSTTHPLRNDQHRPSVRPRPESQRRKGGFWAALCCMGAGGDGDEYLEVVRHRKRVQQQEMQQQPSRPRPPPPVPTASKPAKGPAVPAARAHDPQTRRLLSHIPSHLPAATTSALLAELIKPISPYDEDGYIYIFWLTPQSKKPPDESTARALLSHDTRPANGRRISDVMTEYSFQEEDPQAPSTPAAQRRSTGHSTPKNTIMLKIGRANNITRRLHEWQRQCGYALNLVRWYPYIPSRPSTSTPSPQHRSSEPLYPDLSRPPSNTRRQSELVHKCPHIHRVERLIHLELAGRQVKRQCEACGKEHREWFEVEATRAAVGAVDEVVRRWVGWAEKLEEGM